MERLRDGAGIDRPALGEAEEWGLAGPQAHVCRLIGRKHRANLRTERHQSGLPELGLADDEHLPIEIDIIDGESRHFADAEAEAIEQRKQHAVRGAAVRRAGIVRQCRGKVEQPSCGRLVEDERGGGGR